MTVIIHNTFENKKQEDTLEVYSKKRNNIMKLEEKKTGKNFLRYQKINVLISEMMKNFELQLKASLKDRNIIK